MVISALRFMVDWYRVPLTEERPDRLDDCTKDALKRIGSEDRGEIVCSTSIPDIPAPASARCAALNRGRWRPSFFRSLAASGGTALYRRTRPTVFSRTASATSATGNCNARLASPTRITPPINPHFFLN